MKPMFRALKQRLFGSRNKDPQSAQRSWFYWKKNWETLLNTLRSHESCNYNHVSWIFLNIVKELTMHSGIPMCSRIFWIWYMMAMLLLRGVCVTLGFGCSIWVRRVSFTYSVQLVFYANTAFCNVRDWSTVQRVL